MPFIPRGQLNQAPLLSRLATRYHNKKFIALRVFMGVEVPLKNFFFNVWDSIPTLKKPKTAYGPGGAVNIMHTSATKSPGKTDDAAQGAMIDPDEENQAPGINVELVKTTALKELMELDLEIKVASMATDTAQIPQNHTISGTDQFSDYTNSKPDLLIDGYARAMLVPKRELSIVMGRNPFDTLARHPRALDAIKYTQFAVVTEDVMARWLGVKEVIVGESMFDPTNIGVPTDYTGLQMVWGNDLLLFYRPDTPPTPLIDQPAFGYCPIWGGAPMAGAAGDAPAFPWRIYRSIPNPMVGTGEGQRGLKIEGSYKPLLTASALATLLKSVV